MLEFYASEALACPRRIYFRLKGYPQRWPESMKIRLDQGLKTHEVLGKTISQKFGFEREKHMVLRSERLGFEIHGRIDVFKEFPIEIKGKTSLPTAPLEGHLAQLTVYLRWAEADYGYLYYVKLSNKPEHVIEKLDFSRFPLIRGPNFRLFEVPYEPALFKEILKHFHVVKSFYETEKLPPARRTFACRFCPYRYLCYPGGE